MLIPVVLFIIGLLCLIKGGDWFVDGASALARRFHLPELLIGATVVSIGTTLPEVMVSTMSAVSGHGEIAYGNAIGSVICNAALIAAITIAVRPGKVDRKTLGMPVAFFFVAAAIYCVAAYGFGKFTRPMGLIMLALFVAYMVANVLQMKNAPAGAEAEAEAETAEEEMTLTKTLVLLVAGAVLIAVGANLLVDNGTLIAQALGVPESVIALTFRGPGHLAARAGHGHHVPRQGLQRSLAGQHRGCQRLQSGAGQRRVRDHCAVHHPPELHPVWHQFQSGAGPARDAGRHGAHVCPGAGAGQALPGAGRAAALHLCGVLRHPVHHVSWG